MEQNKQFRKNFIWNTLGTGLNAFNSLFFMIAVTRLNGIDDAGIFSIEAVLTAMAAALPWCWRCFRFWSVWL